MKMLRTIVPILVLALLGQPLLAQARSRVIGTVLDSSGQPVGGVKVTVTSPAIATFHEEAETSKKGRFTLMVLAATVPYTVTLEKEGYQRLVEPVMFELGTSRKKFTLRAGGPAAAAGPDDFGESTTAAGVAAPVAAAKEAIELFNRAAEAYNRGEHGEARELFEAALEKDADLIPAHAALAGLYLEAREHRRALASAEEVLAVRPGDAQALRVAYESAQELDAEEQARQYLDRLEQMEGGVEQAAVLYNEGVSALRSDDSATASEKFEAAIAVDPTLREAHSALALIAIKAEDLETAEAASMQVLQLDPSDPTALAILADARTALGKLQEGLEALERLAAVAPGEATARLSRLGHRLFDQGNADSAVRALQMSLAIDEGQPRVHYVLGLSYLNLGRNPEAKEHLERFLALAPDDPEAPTAREMLEYL